MLKNLKLFTYSSFVILLTTTMLVGCAFVYMDLAKPRTTMAQMISRRGEPARTEIFRIKEDTYHIFFYQKEEENNKYDPLIFKNEKIYSWGHANYQEIKSILLEIKN